MADPDPALASDSQPDTSQDEAERLSTKLAAAVHEQATVGLQTTTFQRKREAAMAEMTGLADRRTAAAEQLSRAQAGMDAAHRLPKELRKIDVERRDL